MTVSLVETRALASRGTPARSWRSCRPRARAVSKMPDDTPLLRPPSSMRAPMTTSATPWSRERARWCATRIGPMPAERVGERGRVRAGHVRCAGPTPAWSRPPSRSDVRRQPRAAGGSHTRRRGARQGLQRGRFDGHRHRPVGARPRRRRIACVAARAVAEARDGRDPVGVRADRGRRRLGRPQSRHDSDANAWRLSARRAPRSSSPAPPPPTGSSPWPGSSMKPAW